MNSKDQVCENAVKYFAEGYNCAQSVLFGLSRCWGLENEVIPKIATGFGGGIGRCGSVCGALTGGVMAISLKFGTNDSDSEKRAVTYELVSKLFRRFEEKHGSVMCRTLINLDLSKPKDLEKAHREKISEKQCRHFIRTVISITLDLH
jgi:C_GCAxxG_C_C family probable redox protein